MPRRILILDSPLQDLRRLVEVIQESTEAEVEVVRSVRALMGRLRRKGPYDLLLVDYEVGDGVQPGIELVARARALEPLLCIVVVAERGNVDAAKRAIEEGANDMLVRGGRLGARVRTLLDKMGKVAQLVDSHRALEQRLSDREQARFQIIGRSPQLRRIENQIERVAKVPRPVLIMGERGTGKELVARAIWRASDLTGSFVVVNCAAIADTLLESELFGHEKGAFSGASERTRGKFEQASGGVLFLDEIGNMSLAFQKKILRVVEYGVFSRVGSNEDLRVSTRIIAATNADLDARISSGEFLPDLYDRLAFEVIRVPPLREREREIELLAQHFLDRFAEEVPAFQGKRLSKAALDMLYRYPFPGNVRELKNIIERAVYRDTTNELTPEDIGPLPGATQTNGGSLKTRLHEYERALVAEALSKAKKNQAEAARQLGLSYHQLRYLCQKHEL